MHRNINWTPARARQVSLAAAHLGLPDGESVIQLAIDSLLVSLSDHDASFKLALARAAGVSWPTLERLAKAAKDSDVS